MSVFSVFTLPRPAPKCIYTCAPTLGSPAPAPGALPLPCTGAEAALPLAPGPLPSVSPTPGPSMEGGSLGLDAIHL